MITLEQAILLASEVYNSQTDDLGNPAIYHPMIVLLLAQKMSKDTRMHIIAVLHDVVHYTDINSIYAKLDDRVLEDALRSITQRQNEPYGQYLMRLSHNQIARNVKMLDLIHNLSRISGKAEFNEINAKYHDALQYLNKRPLEIRSTNKEAES